MTALPLLIVLAAAPSTLSDDVALLHRVVTCQSEALPAHLDAKVVKAYCDRQKPRLERFRSHWGTRAQAFLTGLQPAALPTEVVYPFGGGDLMMALATFPHAEVITTLSLELAGDPRRISAVMEPKRLDASLRGLLEASSSTLTSNDSKSVNLSRIQQGELPGQLSMHLIGLGLFDFVPVEARFFRFEADGSLHYYSAEEIDALEGQLAKSLKSNWHSPDFSPAFSNVEIQFVPRDQPNAKRRVFRHIGANLSNAGLTEAPGVIAHLRQKPRIAAMTKAASYLLWREEFTVIRDYLVERARFMVADSTGVVPRYWKKAGCTVATYGEFETTFLGTWNVYRDELKTEFETQPKRALPMRFGYPDGSARKLSHLVTATCPATP